MPTHSPLSYVALSVVVVLSCAIVILGILLFKRIPSFKLFFKKLSRITPWPLQRSTSFILPSFDISRFSPFYAAIRPNIISTTREHIPKNTHCSELGIFPSQCCTTPPELHRSLDVLQAPTADAGDTSTAILSAEDFTRRTGNIIADKDRLPPNITIPIPRQTPLERMVCRLQKDVQKDNMARSSYSGRKFVQPQIFYAPKEIGRIPKIILTLPSSKPVSPRQSSYTSLLSTGPENDPFFWDSIPLPRDSHAVAHEPPTQPTIPHPFQGFDTENKVLVDLAASNEGSYVLSHLLFPSVSGKQSSGNYLPPFPEFNQPQYPREVLSRCKLYPFPPSPPFSMYNA